jgi:hypothetical protein
MDFKEIKVLVDMNRLLDALNIERDAHSRCACPLHGGDNKTAFHIHSDGQGWTCHTKCDMSGDIFTFMEKFESIDNAQAKIRISDMFNISDAPVAKKKKKKKADRKVVGRCEYVYRDKSGDDLYKVKRVDYDDGSKDCFQEYRGKPTLPKGVRVMYNLDLICGNTNDYIVICEGEKTADAITGCGYIGTTNPLGSKNWDDSYVESLIDQKIIIMPDADEHGEKWRDEVLKSLRGKVEQVQIINIPDEFIRDNPRFSGHDFADYLEKCGKETAMALVYDGILDEPVMPRGVDIELLGRPCDIFDDIIKRAKSGISTTVFNMNEWLPSLDIRVKRGDMITLMGNTSTGKTRILHNIPFNIRRLNYAVFDLELSKETLAIRYAAMENKMSVKDVEERIENGDKVKRVSIDNVFIQKIHSLTVDKIRDAVHVLEEATGREIHVVAIDYVGLMSGRGSSYESTTSNVEAFKAYVSQEGRVGILTTQITRPENRTDGMFECPSPFSSKNSGSIENSTQLLLGFWKDKHSQQVLHARCMKYTHGSYLERDIKLDAIDLLIREGQRDDYGASCDRY